MKKKEIFFPFRKFADEPKCKCLCVFPKCGSRVKPCVCCVQSSDSRFSNACGEPMAPPHLATQRPGLKAQSSHAAAQTDYLAVVVNHWCVGSKVPHMPQGQNIHVVGKANTKSSCHRVRCISFSSWKPHGLCYV